MKSKSFYVLVSNKDKRHYFENKVNVIMIETLSLHYLANLKLCVQL